ncbi:MAG: LytR/AlgR family response regulator transcription factor, partial [Acidobacteriota bacterium]
DYLLKPVTELRFAATMKRVARQLKAAAPAPRDPAIVVTTTRGTTMLSVREIDWIESADNYARLWTGERSYLLRESLRVLEARVGPRGFERAHRRALIRVDGVRELAWTKSGDLVAVLQSGARVPISRRRRAAFAAAVKARAGDGG